ncbi:hypothetical protein HRbin40_02161 [bacterium HR40]|nr:hypothetical protein HRbin40_02161 [bacterium HR40]
MPESPLAPLVVKLGGSLLDSPRLASWLEALARPAPRARLVVAGGGPFADAVRTGQKRWAFSDLAAHRMAILAMQQTALLLHDREPRLEPVEDTAGIEALCRKCGAGVWLPWRLAGYEPSLPASWQVTSDSIALWLASFLEARAAVIVKRGQPPRDPRRAAALGVVDGAFAAFLEGLSCPVHILGEEESGRLSGILRGDEG